jgi:cardiolipin synthase
MRSVIRSTSARSLLLVLLGALSACSSAAAGAERSSSPPPPYPSAPGAPVAVGADSVTVLPRGAVAFPVIARLLRQATRRVELEMYELQRADLLTALRAAHDRGVPVTVITDPTGAGSASASVHLRAAGLDVVDYPVRKLMIDHVKLLVVDDEAVVGGINWGTASARHHDFDVLLHGPVVANLDRVFRRDLATCGRIGAVPQPIVDPGGVEVASTLPSSEIRPLALEAVEGARTTLDLELFVLTDAGIVHAIERARARGVAVRVILDPTQRPSDASAAELRSAGVGVRLYHGSGESLHAKSLVADGALVLFGSANWSGGGFVRNHEIDVEVRHSRAVARTFLAAMEADWAAAGGTAVAGGDAPDAAGDGPP